MLRVYLYSRTGPLGMVLVVIPPRLLLLLQGPARFFQQRQFRVGHGQGSRCQLCGCRERICHSFIARSDARDYVDNIGVNLVRQSFSISLGTLVHEHFFLKSGTRWIEHAI